MPDIQENEKEVTLTVTYEKVSASCYRGPCILDAEKIVLLAQDGKSIYSPHWGVKPAAFILNMQFQMVMRLIRFRQMFEAIRYK